MATAQTSSRQWIKFLRPLFWWGVVLLALVGYHQHKKLMERTRVSFTVVLSGQKLIGGAVAELDGQPVMSGQRISLGKHILTVTHPKGESFATNLFVWYGEHDLGEISLKRSHGRLTIKCEPPASSLRIQVSEYSTSLNNVTEFDETVPTDNYRVEVTYPHVQDRADVMVLANATASRSFNPKFGAAEISCDKDPANFELVQNGNDNVISSGQLPVRLSDLPVGKYRLHTTFHGHEKNDSVTVELGATNQFKVDFAFATAVLVTRPAEAVVSDQDGRDLGQTPLTLSELTPGSWTFQFKLPGYEPAMTTMEIAANESQTFRTNLISQGYTEAMRTARAAMQAGDYERTLGALKDALLAKPDDADALALHHQASIQLVLRNAKGLARNGNYIEAGELLKTAQELLADNPEAAALRAEYKMHEPEQREQARLERLGRTKKLFDAVMSNTSFAELFETHEVKTTKPAKDIQVALYNALLSESSAGQPQFKVMHNETPKPETFSIEAVQETTTALGTIAGKRYCFIVG
ncbi:MAG: hypothetical protein RLZZ350_44, partial [Verrucomicrobiota bacterium]